jgi:hypothetical protein
MTVMATNTAELTIGQLIEAAARLAGIMPLEQPAFGPQWEARARFGRLQLGLIIDRLPATGKSMRDVEFTDVALVEGTASYVLDSDTIDVYGEAAYLGDGDTTESTVRQVDREEWQGYPDKTTPSLPTMLFVDRGAQVTLRLLPVPHEAATLRIQRQRLLADSTDANATPDVERYWQDHLQYELAARFREASGQSASMVKMMRDKAKESLDEAQTKARQATPNQMVLEHPTGWSP